MCTPALTDISFIMQHLLTKQPLLKELLIKITTECLNIKISFLKDAEICFSIFI